MAKARQGSVPLCPTGLLNKQNCIAVTAHSLVQRTKLGTKHGWASGQWPTCTRRTLSCSSTRLRPYVCSSFSVIAGGSNCTLGPFLRANNSASGDGSQACSC